MLEFAKVLSKLKKINVMAINYQFSANPDNGKIETKSLIKIKS
jgi:hypothetical protein